MSNKIYLVVFFYLLIPYCVLSQKSDAELFYDFKNELKLIQDNYKNYKNFKLSNENKIKNEFDNYLNLIYEDYTNSQSTGLTNLIPEIKNSFNNFSQNNENNKQLFLSKINNFLEKWKEGNNLNIINKVAKDYDFDVSSQIDNINTIKNEIESEKIDNYERIVQFLEIIIQDKNEILKLKNQIVELENKIKSKIQQNITNSNILKDVLSENNLRKELIFKLISTIVNEHKIITSSDYAEKVKPSPFSSDIYILLNNFMEDYINISRNLSIETDPNILTTCLNAYNDVISKLDSLFLLMETSNVLKKGEKEDLITKSQLWKNQIIPVFDNVLMSEFTSRNIPIVFFKTNNPEWFHKTLTEFINPYLNPSDEVNTDKSKSDEIRQKFEEAWNSIKEKWSQALVSSKYLDKNKIIEIDNKLETWQSITGGSYKSSTIIIIIIVLIGISLAIYILLKFKRKET